MNFFNKKINKNISVDRLDPNSAGAWIQSQHTGKVEKSRVRILKNKKDQNLQNKANWFSFKTVLKRHISRKVRDQNLRYEILNIPIKVCLGKWGSVQKVTLKNHPSIYKNCRMKVSLIHHLMLQEHPEGMAVAGVAHLQMRRGTLAARAENVQALDHWSGGHKYWEVSTAPYHNAQK